MTSVTKALDYIQCFEFESELCSLMAPGVSTFDVMNNITLSPMTANHQMRYTTQIKYSISLVTADENCNFPKRVCVLM